jgi:hypothetical protein
MLTVKGNLMAVQVVDFTDTIAAKLQAVNHRTHVVLARIKRLFPTV